MKVKELIKELEKFDEDMEVQYDDAEDYTTIPLTEVYIQREDYDVFRKKCSSFKLKIIKFMLDKYIKNMIK